MPFLARQPLLKTIKDLARSERRKVYLVGGFLRDCFLIELPSTNKNSKSLKRFGVEDEKLNNRQKLDFDFAVEKNALKFARQLAIKIKGAYVLLDDEHGCARVVKKQDGQIYTFDFADFRAKTFRADLAHRDFTINTLAVDIFDLDEQSDLEKVLIDEQKGLADLKKKTIRMVSAKAFVEDPLRLMRAFSLRAMLDFKIEPKTLARVKKDVDLLRSVSFERVRDELFKILDTPRAARTLKEMDKIGLLERVIPQIRIMFNCPQGGYHHLDVWPHSLETVAQLEKVIEEFKSDRDVGAYIDEKLAGERNRKSLLKLSALLHDIGKPQTKKIEKDKMSFHGHEHVGKAIVRNIAKNLKLSTKERYILEDNVLHHLRPGYLSNFKNPSEKAMYRYFRDTKDEAFGILLFSLADQRSTRGPLTSEADQKHHEKICLRLIKRYIDDKNKKPLVRLISGNDLIKKLKLEPSPLFGKILKKIEEQQSLGKISTREEALELARGITK